jgi:hypothetical protein
MVSAVYVYSSVLYRYSSTLSLTSALDGDRWSTPRPGRLTPGKDAVPVVLEAGRAPGPVWMGAENLAPHRGLSLHLPSRSKSLYSPRYPCPNVEVTAASN